MKGLILKDIYGVQGFAKSSILSMLIVGVCLSFSVGAEGIIAAVAIMCATTITTTYTLDERYDWQAYALAMPVSRKEYVGAKYMVNALLSTGGVLLGFVLAVGFSLIKGQLELPVLGAVAAVSIGLCLLFGAIIIPLLTYFGAEKARIITMVVFAVPAVIVYLVAENVDLSGFNLTPTQEKLLLGATIIGVILIYTISYFVSAKILEKKEL